MRDAGSISQRRGGTSVVESTPAQMFSQNSASVALPGKSPAMPTTAIAFSDDAEVSTGIAQLETTEKCDESWLRRNAWLSDTSMTHSKSSRRARSRRFSSTSSIAAVARAGLDCSIDDDDASTLLGRFHSGRAASLPSPVGSELAPSISRVHNPTS